MRRALGEGSTVPILLVLLALVVLWYAFSALLNAPLQRDVYARADQPDSGIVQFVSDSWNQTKPVLPSPHQVVAELWKTTVETEVTSKRSLVYHGWITLSSTLLGFALGTMLGVGLAVAIVHNEAADRTLMPWLIASQTIPILAIAPMVIVVLNAVGVSGLIPKALISTYLSFFPIAVGMVKGLRSPETIQLDLMHTYNASAAQTFLKLRWPSAMPFLFTSMKVGVAASLVGAIVAELPAGAAGGFGARLLAGSYYGQTIQIWSALFAAAALAALLITAVGLVERRVQQRMGAPA